MSDLTVATRRRFHPNKDEPVQLVTVERQTTGWVMLYLDGHLVYRRLTRDPQFTRLFVRWPSNGTPNPRTIDSYHGASLGGHWRPLTAQPGNSFDLPPAGEVWHYGRRPDRESHDRFGRILPGEFRPVLNPTGKDPF